MHKDEPVSITAHVAGVAWWQRFVVSSNVLVVALRLDQLVLGWVTVYERVNHLGM